MSMVTINFLNWNIIMTIFFRSFLFALAFGLLATWPVHATEKISDQTLASILQQIDQRGDTTVIVELTSPDLRTTLAGQITDDIRKASVARIQETLYSTLSLEDQQNIAHKYEYIPGIAMRVDTESLERVKHNQYVKAIYENGKRKPSLSQSTKLVFSNQATSRYTGNNEWAIAVLDTGVDKNHTFLKTGSTKKVISEACYSRGGFASNYPEIDSLCPGEGYSSTAVNSGRNCSGYNGCDHGTHVAGIAAGDGDSFDGVARLGKIIAIQVFTGLRDYFNINVCGTGVGQNCIVAFDVDIIKGLERVYTLSNTYKIAAVNMSLGGGSYASSCNSENALLTAAITNLKNAGIATVIASGNDGRSSSISFPACISNSIAVGATYDSGASIDKPTSYSNDASILDLYAPGSYINSSTPGNIFEVYQGTSMAAPHVAGAWAVLKHANPHGTVDEFEDLLKSMGPDVTSRNGQWVRKRLAVEAVLQELSPPANIAPIMPLLKSK